MSAQPFFRQYYKESSIVASSILISQVISIDGDAGELPVMIGKFNQLNQLNLFSENLHKVGEEIILDSRICGICKIL